MSITDAQNRPSKAQSIVAGASTIVSTDMVDLLTANRNVGRGFPKRALVLATTAITAAAGSDLQVQLIQSANANGSAPDVLASSPVYNAAGGIAAGTALMDTVIPDTSKRYLGFQYVITDAAITAGAVDAMFVAETDNPNELTMNTGL